MSMFQGLRLHTDSAEMGTHCSSHLKRALCVTSSKLIPEKGELSNHLTPFMKSCQNVEYNKWLWRLNPEVREFTE